MLMQNVELVGLVLLILTVVVIIGLGLQALGSVLDYFFNFSENSIEYHSIYI